jgi:Acetyltransferase (GNAT) domain
VRREIRKARTRVEVRDDVDLDRFHAVCAKTFARQGLPVPATLLQLARLDAACAARGARLKLSAHDDADRIHAVAYVVWDTNAAFYLLGGADPALRTSGASSLLLWEALRRARDVTDVFDFEGSMLAPVERFFRGFGAVQTPYLRVSRSTQRAAAALALRSGLRRMRRYSRT